MENPIVKKYNSPKQLVLKMAIKAIENLGYKLTEFDEIVGNISFQTGVQKDVLENDKNNLLEEQNISPLQKAIRDRNKGAEIIRNQHLIKVTILKLDDDDTEVKAIGETKYPENGVKMTGLWESFGKAFLSEIEKELNSIK